MSVNYGSCQFQNPSSFTSSSYLSKYSQQETLHYHPKEMTHASMAVARKNRTFALPRSDQCQIQPPVCYYRGVALPKVEPMFSTSDALIYAEAIDEDLLTRLCYAMGLDKLYHLPDLNQFSDFLEGM